MKTKLLAIILIFVPLLAGAVENKILFGISKSADMPWVKEDGSVVFKSSPKISGSAIKRIEPWLTSAGPEDCSGDICLDRIFRISLKEYDADALSRIIDKISLLPDILFVEMEAINKPYYIPNDPQYSQQWFLDQIKADEGWDLWDPQNGDLPGNPDVLLASVDTGVDWDHPDLRNSIWNNLGEDINGNGQTIIQQGNSWILDPGDENGVDDDGNGFIDDLIGWDLSGTIGIPDNNPTPKPNVNTGGTWAHGTHVAGLLNVTTDNNTGISSTAFNCRVMCVKTSVEEDNPDVLITDGYDGILYAAKAGYYAGSFAIINCSWGSNQFSVTGQTTIEVAHDQYNAVIVAAGGNGDDESWGDDYSEHYPSSYEHVVSVAPLGQNDSWGHWATYHESIDISAPGEGIRSTKIGTQYVNWSGSSMASPIVASTMGLLKSLQPDWGNDQIATMVIETADPVLYQVNSENYLQGQLGKGRVDVLSALTTPLIPQITFVDLDIFLPDGDDNDIHAGETAFISTILWNEDDWGDAVDVVLYLNSETAGVSISNQEVFLGNIPSGEIGINFEMPFFVEFAAWMNEGPAEFTLDITSYHTETMTYQISIQFTVDVYEIPPLMGDVNWDGLINISDVVLIVQIILNGGQADAETMEVADLDGNQVINLLDIVNLINIILGE